MAEGILGLGSSGAASLNSELIEKLKTAERASTVEPIESSIEDITKEGGESEKLAEIVAKVNEFLDSVKPFDLFVSGGVTAFDQKSASASGSSVIFDAVDVSSINEGSTTVKINQLAQRDVFQTNKFEDPSAQISDGNDTGDILVLSQSGRPVYQSDSIISSSDSVTESIEINGKTFTGSTFSELVNNINSDEDFNAKITLSGRLSITSIDEKSELSISGDLATSLGISKGEKYSTVGQSYEELAESINSNSNYSASIEAVGSNENRLVIKSIESGLDNSIEITQKGFDLGLEDESNNTVKAQNLLAKVDGVDYDVSSNVLVVNGGLKITAIEVDNENSFSSISVQKDTSVVSTMIEDMVNKYNELTSLVDSELYSAESTIEDKSTLKTMMEGIKSTIFATYGDDDNLSVFNFGIELDKSGVLFIDNDVLNEKIENNLDDLKSLFVGVAENRGLGTQLKEYVNDLDSYDGLLTKYEENMNSRKEALEEEKTKAQEALDNKYSLMATQFASYSAIITQFENQFSGLQMMIQQSISTS